MGYTRDYLIFMLREVIETVEMDDRFNEVGRDEWVWLQQARDIVAVEEMKLDDFDDNEGFAFDEGSLDLEECQQQEDLIVDIPAFLGIKDMINPCAEVSLNKWEPVPFLGGCYGMSVEEISAMDQSHGAPMISAKPLPAPPPPPLPAQDDTMVSNGGQATQDSPSVVIQGTSGNGNWVWKQIPIDVVIVDMNKPAEEFTEKKSETVDDIIFGPVKL